MNRSLKITVTILFLIFQYHFNSTLAQWVPLNTGITEYLNSVYFIDQNTGWVAGLNGKIYKTTNSGSNWVSESAGSNHFYAIFFTDANTGFAAGNGVLYRSSDGGLNWMLQSPPASLYRGIFFFNANTGLFCGSSGIISKTTNSGTNWIAVPSGVNVFLYNIKFSDNNTGFITGENGTVLKTVDGGNTWNILNTGTSDLLFGLSCSGNIVFASGDPGIIIKSSNYGTNWIQLNSGITGLITSLSFLNANTGTACSHGNNIIRTTDGGTTWITQPTGTSGQNFNSVFFLNVQTGFAAGTNGTILKTTTGGFPIPAAPVLTAPLNGAVNVSITPLLDWDSVTYGKTYHLQVDEDSTYSSPVLDSALIIPTSITIPANILQNNTRYYWRVRCSNAGGEGNWSASFNFRTIVAIPNAPGLLLPVNGASNVSLTPFFDWDSTSPADSYTLQAALDTSFSNPEIFISGITHSFLNLNSPPLSNNLRYYWRVNATNIAGTGLWSVKFNFTTVLSMPAAPTLLTPPDNATGISLTPVLDWVEDISATNYQVQVSQDSTFNNVLWDTTGFNISQVQVRAGLLTNVQTYYWRVRTTNPIGTGPWAEPFSFTTLLIPPAAPQLVYPPNNSVEISTTPTLDWDSVQYAETFKLQLSTDSTFSTTLINAAGLVFSQYNVPGGTLSNNTVYFWRVKATNNAGEGPYSQVWKFRTVISPPVAAPTLLAPPNGAVNQPLTLTLDWNDVFGTTGYKVIISTDSLFNTTLHDTTVTNSNLTVKPGLLAGSSLYFWRVRGFNTGGFGPWSVTWHFTTQVIGIEPIGSVIPDKFELYENFPNPFNPVTTIKFDISAEAEGNVKLEIFDVTGRIAGIPVNEYLKAGKYSINWDAGNWASGLYFYRLTSGKYSAVKKMVVLK